MFQNPPRPANAGFRHFASSLLACGVAVFAGAVEPAHAANLIVNGDFTANAAAFTVYPGYLNVLSPGNPVSITGWTDDAGASAVGVNGAGTGLAVGNPFGPTDPGGRTYGFCSWNTVSLSQPLTTLTANTTYRLDFDVAARAGETANYQVAVYSDGSRTTTYYNSGAVAGNNAAFAHVSATFTTPATLGAAPNIQLKTLATAGQTTCYANVSLQQVPAMFITYFPTNNSVTIRITNLYPQSIVAVETTANLNSPSWIPLSTNVVLVGGEKVIPNILVTNPQTYFRARYVTETQVAEATNQYYISSSTGNDANPGTQSRPWQNLSKVYGWTLTPGMTINLKCGDTWTGQKMALFGGGSSTNYAYIRQYGSGAMPIIQGVNTQADVLLYLYNPTYVAVSGLAFKTGLYGIQASNFSTNSPSVGVGIWGCDFSGFNYYTGVGMQWSFGLVMNATYANNMYAPSVANNTFENNAMAANLDHVYGASVVDNVCNNNVSHGITLTRCNSCTVNRLASLYSTGPVTSGVIGAMAESCTSCTWNNCEFAYTSRPSGSHDGGGFDLEAGNVGCIWNNCIFHDNAGPGVEDLGIASRNTGTSVQNCTFWNDALNPPSTDMRTEYYVYNSGNSGSVINCGFYPGSGIPNFGGFTTGYTMSGNRASSYATISSRLSTTVWQWTVDGQQLGWISSAVSGLNASGGTLNGTATSTAPQLQSPDCWFRTIAIPNIYVYMKTSSGSTGAIYFKTESDPTWSESKKFTFPIISDGNLHLYTIPTASLSTFVGVVTQWNWTPSNVSGCNFNVNYFWPEQMW